MLLLNMQYSPQGSSEKQWDAPLAVFRDIDNNCKALLLPESRCGRGLNLTEATGIMFMEPLQSAVGK
jgi:hypothetical protein